MYIGASIRKLTYLFIVFFTALSLILVYWQVAVADAVTQNRHNGRICSLENSPLRGTIYDRNGVWLAKSVPDPASKCGYRRIYADKSLAGLIGYYISPTYDMTGIERQYDDYLSGRLTLSTYDNTVNRLLHRSPIGNDLYLTIDERIQKLVDQHFDDPVKVDNDLSFKTDRGSVIVSNPHTGEVLAMLSRPTFDPNKLVQTIQKGDFSYYNQLLSDTVENPLVERPLQSRYPPGSTYKTVTLLAGLDIGKTTLNEEFNEQQALGPIFINGQQIGPEGNNIGGTKKFPVNTNYGFTHSDNVIFAQIGVHTGLKSWMDYNNRFYVEKKIPFDLPVAVSHVLPTGKDTMESNELAADAFGQGTDFVTPFQMTLFDNAIANDGELMRPFLVSKIVGPDKQPIQTFGKQSLGHPIKRQTALDAREAMLGVIYCGSGRIVRDLSYSLGIIGKTGTAQINNTDPPHGWLVTQAPYSLSNPNQMPALTIVAMKENGGEGGFTDAPMVAGIYTDVIKKGYVKADLPKTPDKNYCLQTGLNQE